LTQVHKWPKPQIYIQLLSGLGSNTFAALQRDNIPSNEYTMSCGGPPINRITNPICVTLP